MQFPHKFSRWVGAGAPADAVVLGTDATPSTSADRTGTHVYAARVAGETWANRMVLGYAYKGAGVPKTLGCNVYQWDDQSEAWYLTATGNIRPGAFKRFLVVSLVDATNGARVSGTDIAIVISAAGGDPDGEYVFVAGIDSSSVGEQQTAVTGGAVDQGAGGLDPWLVQPAGPVTIAQPIAVVPPNPLPVSLPDPLPVSDAPLEASAASIDGKLNSLGQKTMATSAPVVLPSDQVVNAFLTGGLTFIDFAQEYLDAFGRIRVGSPHTIFSSKQVYDNSPHFFTEFTANGGTTLWSGPRSSTRLTVTGAVGSRALRQTKRYFNYQPGKGQLVFVTCVNASQVVNVEKDIGYFDDNNGLFFRSSGAGLYVVRRTDTSGVVFEEAVPQANWNKDKLDGTGPSGLTLVPGNAQIIVIDFAWLGVGRARLGFIIGGEIIYVHQFDASNTATVVYMRTPALPVRWEVKSVAASVGAQLDAICCSVASEAGAEPSGMVHSVDRKIAGVSIGTSLRQLIAIRLRSGYIRSSVFPKAISLLCTTNNANARWVLQYNPTFNGGPAAAWTPYDMTAIEYDVTRNTGGVPGTMNEDGMVVSTGYFTSQGAIAGLDIDSLFGLAADYAGTPDELVLGVQALSGTDNYFGGITWLEET